MDIGRGRFIGIDIGRFVGTFGFIDAVIDIAGMRFCYIVTVAEQKRLGTHDQILHGPIISEYLNGYS